MNIPAKNNRWPLISGFVVIALIGVSYAVWTHMRHGHAGAHEHSDHGASALSLNDGKRWTTDEPLRIGMQRIRDAVAQAVATPEPGALLPAQAKLLADTIQENVAYLMQNCKLEPKADATLHVLINELMAGAAAVTANPASRDGALKLAAALREYPKYFDHPGWSPPTERQP